MLEIKWYAVLIGVILGSIIGAVFAVISSDKKS